MIDKALIMSRFGRAWSSYDQEALFQKRMGEVLISLYPASEEPEEVLELGCGTGLFSQKLLSATPLESRFTFNDLSSEVRPVLWEKVGSGHLFLPGDAESLDWGNGYTLIVSNASIQWWKDPLFFFQKASQSLVQGKGRVLLGTFLPDNFRELNSVTGNTLKYPGEEAVRKALLDAGFTDLRLVTLSETFVFSSITELLRHLKQTGTNGLSSGQKGLWTPARLSQMEIDYRTANSLAPTVSLPLTYSALLISARLL